MEGHDPSTIKRRIMQYNEALDYLKKCPDEFTYIMYVETNRLAGYKIPEWKMKDAWKGAKAGGKKGIEKIRILLFNRLQYDLMKMEKQAMKVGLIEKKWWEFWK